ncbi:5'-3' exoribonuclease 3-like [Phoenix dactylifera]|uniref:5'-3' exoribonuclease n=1 Tax=Phoenix dactylifera TaxID=42345 RepID=A0A8B9B0Y8_PHODC|nr:5'-3' exoribonuclease 3-like [Phoenix dactylifera]
MGVPSFYRWLVGKYPKILINAVEEPGDHVDTSLPNPSGMEFDNLYIDMNSIIHPCFHPEDQLRLPAFLTQLFPPTTIEEVFKAIFQCVDRIFRIVRPRKLLYIAIDGVAPRAKMNHQRARRFQTAKEAEKAEAVEERMTREFEREGKTVLPKREHEVSDSNIITPGTVFMEKLSKALEYYIRSRLNSDPGWKTIKVILSDANVPGEGEHKIMAFIRVQRSLPGYNPNLHHCLCGPDADLIMLALASHEIHFSILREDVLKAELNATTYQFLNIWTLREYLELDMNIPDFKIDIERIIDDFIFICLLLGNDFLPHLPSLGIHEGAIDLMIYVYKKMFKKMGGYLVDMSKINDKKAAYIKVKRVERFILEVGSYEDKIFDKRNRLRQRKLQRLLQQRLEEEGDGSENGDLQYDMKYGVTNEVAEIEDGAYKFSVHNKSCSNFRSSETISKSSKEKRNVSASQNLLAAGHDGNDVINNTKELKQKVKDFLRDKADLFKNGDLQNDKVHLGSPGWKARYYREKFSAETSNEIEITRTNVVEKYVEGLCWVLQYYFARVRSWSWYFPFYYGPFASDIKGLSCSQIKFKFGCPFKPFDQLMAVLPPKSSHALPKAYRPLMNSKDSTIFKFYPTDFDVDMDGKRFLWQGVCKLPFIEEEILLAETRMLERELEVDEMERNSFRNDKIFVRNCHALGLKMCSICTSSKCTTGRSEQKYPLDAVSCGIGGFLCPYDDHLGPHNFKSPIEGMDDIAKDNTFSTFFINPDWPEHIPRLLEDVDIPGKSITEADIVERKLWHEYEGSQPQMYNHETRYLNQARSFGRGRGTSQAWHSTTGGSPAVNANNAIIHRGSDVSGRFPGNSAAAAFRGYRSRYGTSGGSRADANGDWRNRPGAELAVRGRARDRNNRWNGGEGKISMR